MWQKIGYACCAGVLPALLSCSAIPPTTMNPEQDEHYCLNQGMWAEWDALLAKYPTDEDVIALYAFRSGLCELVLSRRIETRTAISLFDRAHQIVIGKTIDRNAAAETKETEL